MAKKKKKAQGTSAGEAMLAAIEAFNTARGVQAEEALTELVSNVVEAVVASPVVETPQDETVARAEVKKIVEEVISSPAGEKMLAAIQESNAPREAVAAPAQAEAPKPTAPYYDITKGMMVNPDGTPYVAPKAAPVPSAAPATPEDVGLAPRVAAPTAESKPGSEAAAAGLVFGAGAGTQAETPQVTPTVPYYDINKGIMVEPDGVAPVVPGPATPKGAVYDIDKGIMVEPEIVEEKPLPPAGEGEEPVTPPVGEGKEPPAPTPGQTYTAPDGKIFTDINEYNAYLQQLKLDEKKRIGQSAYDLLFEQFNQFGLGALVAPLQSLITEGLSAAEFTLRLRETDAYKKRFGANQQRIAKGLRALSEAEYIGLEDQYQNIMRQYGLPESYYTRGDMGRQEGFEKFIAGDVSPSELEDRVATAQNRIIYANPEVSIALKNFYPDISNGDLLAYALDPDKALAQIKRRISAAEIGASAVQLGLTTSATDAEYLARYGVTKEQAQQGYRSVAEVLPRASFLGEVYGKQGMGPYTQQTAEREVFNVPGAAEAAAQRRKLTELEQAQFSGRAGTAGGALARERAGGF